MTTCLLPYFGDEPWSATCTRSLYHDGDHEGSAFDVEPLGVVVTDGISLPPGAVVSGHYRRIELGTRRWNDNQEVQQ